MQQTTNCSQQQSVSAPDKFIVCFAAFFSDCSRQTDRHKKKVYYHYHYFIIHPLSSQIKFEIPIFPNLTGRPLDSNIYLDSLFMGNIVYF